MNTVALFGRLTRDPETNYTQGQEPKPVVNFGLAVDNASNQRAEQGNGYDAGFFECIAFNKTAENIQQYFDKGARIGVEGRLQQDRWQNDQGQNRSAVKVVVSRFTFIETRTEAEQRRGSSSQQPQQQAPPPQAGNPDSPFGDQDGPPGLEVDPSDDPFGDQ